MANIKKFRRKGFADKLKSMVKKGPETKDVGEEELIGAIIECKNPKKFAKDLEEKHPQIKVKYVYNIIKAIAVETTASEILDTLSPMNDVQIIDEDLEVHIMLSDSMKVIGVDPGVWDLGVEGGGVTVAVVDTGIDKNHPDLKGKVVSQEDFTNEKGTSKENIDGNGHGTHVAGTIAGTGKSSNGKYKGVAPKAKLIAAKVLASNGSGSFSGVIAGIDWAASQDCQVMNLSLGANVYGSCDGSDPTCQAVDAAMDKGIVMCIAAGNSGPESKTVGTPGCAKKVITVGATDKNDGIAWFSSRGPTKDNRVKPDVCFPGVNIVAPRANNTTMGTPVGDKYTSASGTSMATPHCAGVSALLKSVSPKLSSHKIKDIIMNNVKDLNLDPNTQGKGRSESLKAIKSIIDHEEPGEEPVPEPDKKSFYINLGILIAIFVILTILLIITFSII
ncbi:MAG: S8 family serine peptidase [Candidatus Lokiarchaeota archaeon]|nr:S8 family serine peptidase [Candidatus Lokiarchaeota archaeon]